MAASPVVKLALSPLAVQAEAAGSVSIHVGRQGVSFPDGPGVRVLLHALAQGASQDSLNAGAMDAGGVTALFAQQQAIKRLDLVGALARTLEVDGKPVATLEPLSFLCPAPGEAPEGSVALSRFAMVRREGEGLVLDSPAGQGRVRLRAAMGGAVLATLSAPADAVALARAMRDCGEPGPEPRTASVSEDWVEAAAWVLRLLACARALTGSGALDEDANAASVQWQPHDLLFHARSRVGRHVGGYGGTFRFRGRVPEPPVLRAAMSERVVALPRPDIDALRLGDVPFQAVLEDRRSIREHGSEPITVQQLGEFLYRSARAKNHWKNEHGEAAPRMYPGGGGLYELEIYPVVDRCEGLDGGLYRYDAVAHALEHVSDKTPEVEGLLAAAFFTTGQISKPHVLLCVTARFDRVQWKYESMAYALVLKHVGVLFQNLYLVATAMGLAPCALGGGDSDLFAKASGLDWMTEGTVGEFVIGASEPEA